MILIVDDRPETCRPLVTLLKMEGIEAYCIADPFEAVGAIAGRPPDLLVLDFEMPGLSGIELLRAIRANPALAEIPVIFYSASETGQDAAQELGALDWVVKGETDWVELHRRIIAAYRGARTRADNAGEAD